MRLSLRNKTIFGVAIIEAALLLMLIVTTVNFMHTSINEGLVKRATTTATLFSTTTKDAVLSYDLASLDTFVIELMKNPDMQYVRVLTSDGDLLAAAGSPELINKPFIADSEVNGVNDGIFDTQALINEGNETFGKIELGLGVSGIQQALNEIMRWITGIAIVEMVLVALFSYLLGSYLTAQLNLLRKGAKSISESVSSGKFSDNHIPIKGSDELAEVTVAFNKLVDNLVVEYNQRAQYQNMLEELNQDLEKRVESRTQKLAEKNQQLLKSNQDLKTAQEQLLQAEKMASIGQLAAGVAHEINNPIGFVASNLTTLTEYTEIYNEICKKLVKYLASKDVFERKDIANELAELMEAQDIEFINEDSQDLVKESSEGLLRVKEIVQGLKQFSRADADEMQLFDINECVKTTLNMVSNELKYHCEIETNLAPLPKAKLNVGKICQVLTNLLINAGQAIEGKGTIKVTSTKDKGWLKVAIADTGKGIKKEHLSSLFNPFFTTKPEGEGTGLGLSISYGIAKDHGGDIIVSSIEGKGSCFVLSIPLIETETRQIVA